MTATIESIDQVQGDEPGPGAEPFGRVTPVVMAIGGLIGLYAAGDLNTERLRVALDPDYTPSCSWNVLLDCGVVSSSPEAEALGFPNTIIGIAAFASVVMLAAVLLLGGRVPRAVWAGMNAGLLLGVGFVHWLIYTSAFELNTLCPWCMVVWSVTIPLFWYVTIRNMTNGVFGAAVRDSAATRLLASVHAAPVVLWFAGVITLLAVRFADNWAQMLGL